MSILKKLKKMDENKICDDDHPNRPDITEEEFVQAIHELKAKYPLKKGVKPNKST